MLRRPPRSTRTDTLFPYTTLFRSTSLCSVGGATRWFFRKVNTRLSGPIDCFKTTRLSSIKGLSCSQNRTSRLCLSRSCTRKTFTFWNFRSEEHTSELQSLMRISYAVFCLTKKKKQNKHKYNQ